MDHDSFLEELELVSATQKPGSVVHHAERYITSRRSQSPTTKGLRLERDELEALIKQQLKATSSPVLASSPMLKTSIRKSVEKTASPIAGQSKIYLSSAIETIPRRKVDAKDKKNEPKKQIKETKQSSSRSKHSEKKVDPNQEKLKPVENIKHLEVVKTNLLLKDRTKKPSETKESSKLSDGSSKENSRPSDSSEDTSSEAAKERRRLPIDNSTKKSEVSGENDSVVMLSAIKDIVSGYTKAESAKMMKMMQDLYINSQASLIKQLLIMGDDIRDLLPAGNNSPQVQNLIQENEQLKHNVTFLKNKVEELQKENVALKKKFHEHEK